MGIKYYDKEYDPRQFDKGWRGFVIRLLAQIVAWLERRIEWHVMHYIAHREGLASSQVRELRGAFRHEEEVKRVRTIIRDILQPTALQPPREERYQEGRKSESKTYREKRAERASSLFQAVVNGPPRARRYLYNRAFRMADPEGDTIEQVTHGGRTQDAG